jgi:hypothetical protein
MVGARVAGFLGGGLLVGLLVLAVFARIDRERVGKLESFSETTAVGDKVYYRVPNPVPNPPVAIASFGGKSLAPVNYEKLDLLDTHMQPAARDPKTQLTIYVSRDPLPAASGAQADDEFYFVKTASNEYLRLRAAP